MEAREVILTAVFIPIVVAFTIFIVIPIPATEGFFNIGEAGVYLAAFIGGPAVGAIAGGVGSAISDLALGYGKYAPGTLVIKGCEGLVAGWLYRRLKRLDARLRVVVSALPAGGVMVLGYFLYEAFVLGAGVVAALVEVPFNIVQVAAGVAVSFGAISVLKEAGYEAGGRESEGEV